MCFLFWKGVLRVSDGIGAKRHLAGMVVPGWLLLSADWLTLGREERGGSLRVGGGGRLLDRSSLGWKLPTAYTPCIQTQRVSHRGACVPAAGVECKEIKKNLAPGSSSPHTVTDTAASVKTAMKSLKQSVWVGFSYNRAFDQILWKLDLDHILCFQLYKLKAKHTQPPALNHLQEQHESLKHFGGIEGEQKRFGALYFKKKMPHLKILSMLFIY